MKRRILFVLGLVFSVLFILAAFQPAIADERVVELKITGCGCPEDEHHIALLGRQIKGVSEVKASFISHSATFTFDDKEVTVEEIIDTFNRSSFRVTGKPKWIK